MTFLQTPTRIVGLTNKHVATKISSLADDPNITLQLGGARFDPDRLIDVHPDLDLASYDVSDVLLATAGHMAGTVTEWPIQLPSESDALIVGGWPAVFREPTSEDRTDFGFLWVAGRINGVSDRMISINLQLENSTAISESFAVAGTDLGGWSGGPVFRCIDTGLIEHIEVCGLIFEGSIVAFAHPLTSLNDDGTFTRIWSP